MHNKSDVLVSVTRSAFDHELVELVILEMHWAPADSHVYNKDDDVTPLLSWKSFILDLHKSNNTISHYDYFILQNCTNESNGSNR